MDNHNSARGAPQGSFAYKPTGFRRMTPGLLKADHSAEKFNGFPAGVENYGQLLAAFKSAVPRLGIPSRLVHAIDHLFRFTRSQDWEKTSRPIVWPSALEQQRDLGLKPSQVKAINRRLAELGLVTMKDSPSGKRYGRRYPDNKTGRITEAYGFDLSLFAARYEEFVRLGKEEKAERRAMGRLKRRRSIAHKAIIQILETAEEHGLDGEEWQTLSRETRDIIRGLLHVERLDEMEAGVVSLERRWHAARERINELLKPVDSDPKGPENRPQYYNYNPTSYLYKDTVIAAERRSQVGAAPPVPHAQHSSKPPQPSPETLHIKPGTLIELAPRLAAHITAEFNEGDWRPVIDAARELAAELGVSPTLWGQACGAMGREYATVALAIVSTWPADHFTSGPGGYFAGMLRKFKKNPEDLRLNDTLYKLKEQLWGKEGHKERRKAENARRRSAAPEPVRLASAYHPTESLVQRPIAAVPPPSARPALPAPPSRSPAQLPTPAPTAKSSWTAPADLRTLHADFLRRQTASGQLTQEPVEGTRSTSASPNNGTPPDGDKR